MSTSYSEVDVNTALKNQADGVVILDVRESDEFEAGHALGAINIPLSQLSDRIDEIDKSVEINVICRSGGRSATATTALIEAGYNAANIKGGSLEWLASQLPFVSQTQETPKVI